MTPLLGVNSNYNYTAIVRPLQWLVVGIIFIFFLRVARAVWVEVRPAGIRQSRRERRREAKEAAAALGEQPAHFRRKSLYLEVLEPPEQAGGTFELEDEMTIGRSPGCGVTTSYDVFSSTLHARLYRKGGQLFVEDLHSTNGTFVNSERITQPTKLARGDLVQVGATVFEVTR